jgi:hypothetical protein
MGRSGAAPCLEMSQGSVRSGLVSLGRKRAGIWLASSATCIWSRSNAGPQLARLYCNCNHAICELQPMCAPPGAAVVHMKVDHDGCSLRLHRRTPEPIDYCTHTLTHAMEVLHALVVAQDYTLPTPAVPVHHEGCKAKEGRRTSGVVTLNSDRPCAAPIDSASSCALSGSIPKYCDHDAPFCQLTQCHTRLRLPPILGCITWPPGRMHVGPISSVEPAG